MPLLQEYTLKQDGSRYFAVWQRNSLIETALGCYTCELVVEPDEYADAAMEALADEAAMFLTMEHIQVADLLLAHLRRSAQDWGHDFVFAFLNEGDGLKPDNVTGEKLFNLYGGGCITVSRFRDKPELKVTISFEVPYDLEHGLVIDYEQGRFTKINDCSFSIECGRIRYDTEREAASQDRSAVASVDLTLTRKPGPLKLKPRIKKFIWSKGVQAFTEDLRASLAATIAEQKKDMELAWRTLGLPDAGRVLLTSPDGWSFATLRHYVGKHRQDDDWLLHAAASSLCALLKLARMIREMERALEFGEWPPPPFVVSECDLVKEMRAELARLPPPPPRPPIPPGLPGFRGLQKVRQQNLESRRRTNNYVAPTWWISFSRQKQGKGAAWKAKVLRSLMKALSQSLADAESSYERLSAGEAVQIPLARRADWSPVRFEFEQMGIKTDLKAIYEDPSGAQQTQ